MTRLRPNTKRYDYTKGPIGRGLVVLSLPIFAELISWNIDTIVEIYWVGQLGSDALGAMSLGYMIPMMVRAMGMGIRVAGQALVAQRVGANDEAGAAIIAGQCILLQTLFFIPVCSAGYIFSPYLMGWMTSDPRLLYLSTIYLQAGFITLLFVDGIFTLANIFRGAGEPKYSLLGMIINSVVTFIAMPTFIFGFGLIPPFHLAGAYFGLGIGRLAGSIVMLIILFKGNTRIHLKWRHLIPRSSEMKRILELGWPAWGQMFFERGANLVLVWMLAPFGALALAAWGLGSRVNNMGRMPGFSLQGAVRTMVGQNIGARKPERAIRSAWVTVGAVVSIMVVVITGFVVWSKEVVTFFGIKGAALPHAVICLQVLCVGLGFEATRRVVAGIFEGASSTRPPMIVEAIVRWVVQLPGAYMLAVWMGLQELGIWWAVAASQLIGGLALFSWFAIGWRRRMESMATKAKSSAPSNFEFHSS